MPFLNLSIFFSIFQFFCLVDNSEPLESIEKQKNIKGYQFDVIKRIEFQPDFIVTISTDMQEISVWDVTKYVNHLPLFLIIENHQ